MVDPNGKEVNIVNGGVEFTGSDAESAYNVLTRRKTNVYININNDPNLRREIQSRASQSRYGAWAVFSTANFESAVAAMEIVGNMALDNLALETHGGIDGNIRMAYMRTDDLPEGYEKR